jgi:hypothetical protein
MANLALDISVHTRLEIRQRITAGFYVMLLITIGHWQVRCLQMQCGTASRNARY